ncbi:MAG: tol-pal system protein YbgF [Polaromonas sp.]|nr:tol-pal system protein YbgF [Polaromonas sp.]
MTIKSPQIFRAALGFAVAGLLAFSAHFSAYAGILEDDEARRAILDLRQKVDAMQQRFADEVRKTNDEVKKTNDDNVQLRRSVLDLANLIETLRADLAKLRGQDEQLARDVAEVQRKQKDLNQGIDERFRKFEPAKVSVDGREFVAAPSEMRDFDAALAMLRKGEFAAAQNAFLDFDRRYPESGYKPSLLFWLGNAQYALRAYKEAILNFKALLTLAPDHVRSPEAALSIANCQMELKDIKSARKTLEDLIKVYPQSEAASVAKDRLTKLK